VDSALQYQERAYVARTLQQSLLPGALPQIPGAEVAAEYVAGGEGMEVGGDFYDVFAVGDEDEWALVIGDVCGKGADAAAVTALARYTLRATAMHQASPAEVLRTLNDAMMRQQGDRRFCTVLYVRFDPTASGMRATIAAGGHPLPLALRAGREPTEAGVPGTLLGVVSDPDIRDVEVELASGDVLVLYTDGVTEARAPTRVWGATDLARFVGDHEPLRATAIAERIERGALAAQAQEPRDDVAIVVVKIDAAGSPAPVSGRREDVWAV
jgi:serine phosphatase RsbU (regulator of sigma subunit)